MRIIQQPMEARKTVMLNCWSARLMAHMLLALRLACALS